MSYLWLLPFALSASAALKVSIVKDTLPGLAARHGIVKLKAALEQKGAGCEEVSSLAQAHGDLIVSTGTAALDGRESLLIRQRGKTIQVTGGDDRGQMYALLEIADRVAWASDPQKPFSEVKDVREKPATLERSLSMYTMNKAHFESFFFNEDYWARYFDMLARNRFNTFSLLFAYEAAGYFAPAYPYFFDVEGFPNVRVVDQTKEQQQRNLKMLNRVIDMAHERGLNVTIGLWDHIYRGGVQGPKELAEKPTQGLVWGVTTENLTAYITAAFEKFLREVPAADMIQFRMHGESGLLPTEMGRFWEAMYQIMKRSGGKTRFDFRVKDFGDDLIYRAVDLGLNFRLSTKYWEEQMGLPFHPTHVGHQDQANRRHSYADLLRYPQKYKMQWQLWTGGTARILLWSDPEYVRRFVETTHLYDGEGFDVNEPLATKNAGQTDDVADFPLLNAANRYYDYEFERYWHFYQIFGRIGYNPSVSSEMWDREFVRRFGKDAGPIVEQALHRAGAILPRIVASSYPYSKFPTTRGWAEKQRMDDLPVYAKMEPSDTQQFESPDEAARAILEGSDRVKITPEANSRWFARISADVLALAAQADKGGGKELASTLVDLRILAHLAEYHSHRTLSAQWYAIFNHSKSRGDLEQAILTERQAADAWEGVVRAAGDVYASDLRMGLRSVGLSGHWTDELALLKKGIAALEQQRDALPAGTIKLTKTSPDHDPPSVSFQKVATAPAGKPIRITAKVTDPSGVKWVHLRYRAVNQTLEYKTLDMARTNQKDEYATEIPASEINPQWDVMYFIEAIDKAGNGKMYPDLEKETPYVIVKLMR